MSPIKKVCMNRFEMRARDISVIKIFRVLGWRLWACHCFPHNFWTKWDNVSLQQDSESSRKNASNKPYNAEIASLVKKWGHQTFISKFSNKNRQKFQKNFVCSLCFDDNFWMKNASVFNKKTKKLVKRRFEWAL